MNIICHIPRLCNLTKVTVNLVSEKILHCPRSDDVSPHPPILFSVEVDYKILDDPVVSEPIYKRTSSKDAKDT